MNSTKRSLIFRAALAVAIIAFSLALFAQAQTFTTLASFSGGNGKDPYFGSVVQGTNGNYYGTTYFGGKYGGGVIFEVTPSGKLSDIYNFCAQPHCHDGQNPWSAPVLGSDGNLYGTTNIGGSYGAGTVFKMTLGGKLTTLYSFCPTLGCTDGAFPVGLVQASNGNFYGTTSYGGSTRGGTIFEISAAGKFKLLYTFCSKRNCADGYSPSSGPIQASNGNLYGTTALGGNYSNGASGGTAYEITPTGLLKTLYSFCAEPNCADGQYPSVGLSQDSNGNFYGTASSGGAYGYGTVFEITTTNQLITLHSFDFNDGAGPLTPPFQASDGNFYGMTIQGGAGIADGSIYEITSAGVFSSLFSFCGASSCIGQFPEYTLAQSTNGELIAAVFGGAYGYGMVFSYSIGVGPIVETVPKAAKVGARVIILGNGLTGSTKVSFNGTTAAFTVVSDTEITATVPVGATTGRVAVTTPAGTLYSNPAFQVTK